MFQSKAVVRSANRSKQSVWFYVSLCKFWSNKELSSLTHTTKHTTPIKLFFVMDHWNLLIETLYLTIGVNLLCFPIDHVNGKLSMSKILKIFTVNKMITVNINEQFQFVFVIFSNISKINYTLNSIIQTKFWSITSSGSNLCTNTQYRSFISKNLPER